MTYQPRPFQADSDLTALVVLHNVVEAAEGREATLTAEQMLKALDAADLYRWVVPMDGGALAGYGVLYQQTTERCYGDVKVRPNCRRQGIGRLLADQLAAKAAELGCRHLAIDVDAGNQDALRFLLSQGFRYRGPVWKLLLPAEATLLTPLWPSGYTVRTLADVDDLLLFVELCNMTFGDLWGHWENTPGMVTVERMRGWLEHSDREGVFIVYDAGGKPVAQCRTFPAAADAPAGSPHGLDQPGVVPEHRAAGLHAPLALMAAHWLRQRDSRPVRLESWGDSAERIAQYEALGFSRTGHEVSYVRELDHRGGHSEASN